MEYMAGPCSEVECRDTFRRVLSEEVDMARDGTGVKMSLRD